MRFKTGLVWALQVLAGASFMLVGGAKFWSPIWARLFAQWGYPAGFRMIVGVVEIAGGLALWFPALTSYAALVLAAVMMGAVATQLLHAGVRAAMPPLVWLLLVSVVGYLRRKSVIKRAPHARERAVV